MVPALASAVVDADDVEASAEADVRRNRDCLGTAVTSVDGPAWADDSGRGGRERRE